MYTYIPTVNIYIRTGNKEVLLSFQRDNKFKYSRFDKYLNGLNFSILYRPVGILESQAAIAWIPLVEFGNDHRLHTEVYGNDSHKFTDMPDGQPEYSASINDWSIEMALKI